MKKSTFKNLKIDPIILDAIDELGFKNPTEIQDKAIPILLNSQKDFVGQAQTGTGKTAAFVIPLLEKIDYDNLSVQALVLCPTRELASQVEKEIEKLGKYTDARSTCIYGGTGYEKQIRSLKSEKPQIVVGTPGRIIDLMNKGILKLDKAKFCVLDEADEMLKMGFFDDVQIILDLFKEERQLIMFSATMPDQILKLIKKSFNEYEMAKIESVSLSNDDIDQQHFVVREKHFKEALSRLIDISTDVYGLIFCRTKIETKEVGDDLKKRGHDVEVLNGDMGQAERDHAMRKFKEKKVNLMVCTDVAARGIDVTNLTHVFNYGLPQDNESYVHRIGRTGRAGMKGKAFTIVGPKSAFIVKKIEKHINGAIPLAKLPTIEELKSKIVEKEIESAGMILDAITDKGSEFKSDASFDAFLEKFKDVPADELLKLMFTWKFNKTLRHYNNLSDIEGTSKGGGGGRRDFGRRGRPASSRGGRSGGRRDGRSGGGGRSGGSAGGRPPRGRKPSKPRGNRA